ncbi:MAG TPA: toll/interleukin-1 receptor domain-containing protein [Pyrinomonadaceae bacterium]|jgi:hypothetical protein
MNVMLSYRRADISFANKLAEYLRSEEIPLWIDREGIKPGTKWREELLEELRSCDACVPILSPKYIQSEYCRMEIFIARSFGRHILPVMVENCFPALRDHEETKGLEDIFMMRMYHLSAVGLPITEQDAFRRIADAIRHVPQQGASEHPVYISYTTKDGEFATTLARSLAAKGIATWIATLDVRVGENWRDAQARAMMRASSHLVVLDENMVNQDVLRTEILLSEARGLDTFTILPPRLSEEYEKIEAMIDALNNSDQTYRRLADTHYFSCVNGVDQTVEQLHEKLVKERRA